MISLFRSLLLVLVFSLSASPPSPAWAICGDGTVDGGEDCDDGDVTFEAGESCLAECTNTRCGQTTGSGGAAPTATDALFALRSVVGSEVCDTCVCDTDGNGNATASDVLRILAAAVGQDITLACPACSPLVRQGSLTLLPILPIPAEVRDTLLEQRAELEALGYVMAEDGSTVGWPEQPARGWLVRMGDRLTLTDENGDFTVSLDEGGATVGSIAHPQQPDSPLFEIRADQLGRLEDDAVEFEFELEFNGGCGMNDDLAFPDPAPCDDILAETSSPQSLAHTSHQHHGHDHSTTPPEEGDSAPIDTKAFSETDPLDAQRSEALGTYPLGNQNCCRQYDGFGDGDTTTPTGVITNYIGSTCARLVNDGCCAGELGSVKNSALNFVGLLDPISCKRNHKGRYCQEVTQGNLVGQVRGSIVGRSSNNSVTLGESVDITIHNNGCFGETYVEKTLEEIFGALTGSALSGDKITHFDGTAPLEMYMADRDLTYTTPRCTTVATGNERDVYTFSADGAQITMRFILNTENLWRFVEDGSVFDGEQNPPTAATEECPEFHLRGTHPCNDAPDPGGPCGHGAVERLVICGDGVISLGEDCEPGMDSACPGECEACDCPGTVCGNDIVEADEECDGTGLPGCTEVCLLDCTCIECGNGRIDPTEECDGSNLGGATCETQQLVSGTLSCTENCFFDTTACLDSACGNSIPDPGEECDDGNDIDTDECRNDCTIPECGDGRLDSGEQCDGDDFFCHGGTCLPDCGCDNQCATNADCGADVCLLDRCITDCDKNSDCDPGEFCTVPAVTEGGDLQAGCSPPFGGGAPVGERCSTGEDCGSFSCYSPSGECSEFCSPAAGGDEECPGGACLEVLPGTNYGLCATACKSESDCDSDQTCQLVGDTSEDEYDGACGLTFGAGELGDPCTTSADCNNFLCFSPPAAPGFCTTNDQCGSDAICTNFFVCAQPTCTQFCESNSDCGGSHSVCKSTPFPTPLGSFTGTQNFCAVP